MARRLEGRIAVVIGQATADAFAKEGADVAITYLHDKDGAEQTRAGVEAAGRRAIVMRLDQRDPEQEIARLAVYLASDDADYVTGQTFTIDDGLEMNVGQGA